MEREMADSVVLDAKPRTERGSRQSRRLRKNGTIPAVLYGHKEETLSIGLTAEDLEKAIRHGVRVIDLKTGANLQKALISEIQWDFLGKEILHVDLTRVAADERITVSVKLEVKGIAPGVTGGGVLDQPMHELSIECLAISIPESIRVNVSQLQLDGAIYVKDIALPPDVKAMDDPEAIVVHVVAKQLEAEPVAEAVSETAEPEVIAKKVAEEEEPE
jgi:large subunit ribosomal protein L25